MPTEPIHNEKELLLRIGGGDEAAFTQLFNKHWDRVYSTALVLLKQPEQAKDVAQDVFLRMWNNRKKAQEILHVENYLFTITRNLVYSRFTHSKIEAAYLNYLQNLVVNDAPEGEKQTELNELATLIESGIRCLPPQQQRAFRLSREKGMTHEEIAHEMNINRETVKDYIVRAIAFMRKYLKEYAMLVMVLLKNLPLYHSPGQAALPVKKIFILN